MGKKKKEKKKREKLQLSLKRIVDNNWFALKLLFQTCPGKAVYMLATSALATGLDLATLYFLRYAVDIAQSGGTYGQALLWLIALGGATLLYSLATNLLSSFLTPYFDAVMDKKLKRMMLKKAAECDLACYEDTAFYEKYTCAMAEGSSRCDSVLTSVADTISAIIRLFGAGLIALLIDPVLFVFVLAPFVFSFMRKGRQETSHEMDAAKKEIGRRKGYPVRVFYQSNYAKEVRATNVDRPVMKRFEQTLQDAIDMYHTYGTKLTLFYFMLNIVDSILSYYLVYLYIAWKTLVQKSMLPGDCFVSVITINNVLGSFYSIINSGSTFYEHALYVENMRFLLDYEPKISKNENGPAAREGDIALEHVSFSYFGSEQRVLQDITLTIRRGEKLALVGKNGAGKTTLTKLLLRLYDPTEGKITLAGDDIRTLNLESYHDMYATVLQDYRHFSMSVKENVLLRREEAGDDALVTDALKKSNALDFVEKYPAGMQSILDREFDDAGVIPSGGQAQMLAIAHVHAKGSPIVILDEPSSALDPIAEYKMYENMMEACRDKTVIFISHRMSSSVLADRVVFLEDGKIEEIGSHQELMEKNGKYAEMFRVQASIYTGQEKSV